MTPEEKDRLVALEEAVAALARWHIGEYKRDFDVRNSAGSMFYILPEPLAKYDV